MPRKQDAQDLMSNEHQRIPPYYNKNEEKTMKLANVSLGVVIVMLMAGITCRDALALRQRGDYPWKNGRNTWQEKEMFDAIGTSWYLPVGPTGIRAQITTEQPQQTTSNHCRFAASLRSASWPSACVAPNHFAFSPADDE
jgi:hypothetical protein